MSQIEQNILKQAYRFNWPVPERIQNAPVLQLGLQLYLASFFDLSGSRPVGFGIAPISVIEVIRYSEVFKFTEDQTDDLIFYVRTMDDAYLKFSRKEG